MWFSWLVFHCPTCWRRPRLVLPGLKSIMCNADPLFLGKEERDGIQPFASNGTAGGMGLGLSIDDTLTKPRRDKKTSDSIAGIQHTPFFVRHPK